MPNRYFDMPGGHLGQDELIAGRRANFTEAYVHIPRDTMRDIVASYLPHWHATRLWVLARPLSGFAETFSHYLMEVSPGGGSDRPEEDPKAEGALFVTSGRGVVRVGEEDFDLVPGRFVYIPPGTGWSLKAGDERLLFHWIRKAYQRAEGIALPTPMVADDSDIAPDPMPGTGGRWATTRFVDPTDIRHDMHITIVTMDPGAIIPFMETHVMEHGLYILQGKGAYRLNQDFVEVEAGDYLWLRAFCPQACYAGGSEPFRYLLYKDVNRHMPLRPFGANG